MKKYLVVLGLTAMMLFAVGCNEKDTVEAEEIVVTESVYDETINEMEELSEELVEVSLGYWFSAIEEIFGEDFDPDKLESNEYGLTYGETTVSWDYIDEVAYNIMINEF